jgi:Protein of unknown function (DUF3592)
MKMTASDSEARPITRAEHIRLAVMYWGFLIACLVFAAVGLDLVRAQEMPIRNAHPVTATIDHVDVVTHKDTRGRPTQQPIVLYSYQVNGVHYSTDRVTLRDASRSGSWATDMAARFHAGETVTAYYDPADPGAAFLIAERSWAIFASFIVPLAVALVLACLWPRAIRPPSTSR